VRRLALTLLALVVPLACGGRSEEREQGSGGTTASGGKGGSGTGGNGATGGAAMTGGTGATGGTAGTGMTGGTNATGGTGAVAGTGSGCCLAYPACGRGEVEYQGPCAPELGCHSVTLCCSTIQCGPEPLAAGGTSGTGGSAGTSATGGSGGDPPSDAGVDCNPELEHDRNYVGDPRTCTLIDFGCAEPTRMFFNDCGCGCEQDALCPDAFDCGPGARVAPHLACTPENLAHCPFSEVLE
jgi:hypothetical protein